MVLRSFAIVSILACTLGAAAPEGRIAIQGGRHLYLVCRGAGSPTVVLDAGLRTRGDIWSSANLVPPKAVPVVAGVKQFTRVCTFDRPGTIMGPSPKDFSRSDPAPMPRTAAAAVKDLHALLRAAAVTGPYVLVGHSFGGLNTILFASTYPRSVAGLVFVDALVPQLRDEMSASDWKAYNAINAQPLRGFQYKDLERMDFIASVAEVKRALATGPLPRVPTAILTKTKPFDLTGRTVPPSLRQNLDAAWSKAERQFAASLPYATFKAVDTDHNMMVERPAVVIDAIRRVVDAARNGGANR